MVTRIPVCCIGPAVNVGDEATGNTARDVNFFSAGYGKPKLKF